jgi:hypothetical protein
LENHRKFQETGFILSRSGENIGKSRSWALIILKKYVRMFTRFTDTVVFHAIYSSSLLLSGRDRLMTQVAENFKVFHIIHIFNVFLSRRDRIRTKLKPIKE